MFKVNSTSLFLSSATPTNITINESKQTINRKGSRGRHNPPPSLMRQIISPMPLLPNIPWNAPSFETLSASRLRRQLPPSSARFNASKLTLTIGSSRRKIPANCAHSNQRHANCNASNSQGFRIGMEEPPGMDPQKVALRPLGEGLLEL